MTPYEYLKQISEPVPNWLAQFNNGDAFSRDHFFASRIVYYPGSGTDGQPVKLFGSTHSAHCYVFADYGTTQTDLESELDDVAHGFHGYKTLTRIQLTESELTPSGWSPHVDHRYHAPHGKGHINTAPFGFLEILERESTFDESYGAFRLAILFLGADGIATYDAFFCQQNDINLPFAVILQDHGFGGNYDQFGEGGLLASIASRCGVIPELLLVAKNTKPWEGFSRISNVTEDIGGMHNTRRYFYKR